MSTRIDYLPFTKVPWVEVKDLKRRQELLALVQHLRHIGVPRKLFSDIPTEAPFIAYGQANCTRPTINSTQGFMSSLLRVVQMAKLGSDLITDSYTKLKAGSAGFLFTEPGFYSVSMKLIRLMSIFSGDSTKFQPAYSNWTANWRTFFAVLRLTKHTQFQPPWNSNDEGGIVVDPLTTFSVLQLQDGLEDWRVYTNTLDSSTNLHINQLNTTRVGMCEPGPGGEPISFTGDQVAVGMRYDLRQESTSLFTVQLDNFSHVPDADGLYHALLIVPYCFVSQPVARTATLVTPYVSDAGVAASTESTDQVDTELDVEYYDVITGRNAVNGVDVFGMPVASVA